MSTTLQKRPQTVFQIIKSSASEFKSIKSVATMAILLALCCAVGMLNIPILGGLLHIKFTFLIYALTGLLYGPVMGALLGIGDQLIAETLFKGNPILIGYVISFAFRGAIYGFALYHPLLNKSESKHSFSYLRLAIVKVIDTIVNNIFFNTFLLWYYKFVVADSLWTLIIARVAKNVVLLPFEILLLAVFIRAMLVPLQQLSLIPKLECFKVKKIHIIMSLVAAVVGVAAVVVYILV